MNFCLQANIYCKNKSDTLTHFCLFIIHIDISSSKNILGDNTLNAHDFPQHEAFN